MNIDQNLIIIIISFGLLALGLIRWQKGAHLNKIGKITEGIIYNNNYKSSHDGSGMYYPVVRFLTQEKTWITKELEIGFSPSMKQGKKVNLIYDPKDPNNVTFYSELNLKIIPIGLTILGISGIIYGVVRYLEIL
ncbi:DUF3592 domain-containing protein [uncultured Psychroserpens sp.]|uniref:DUF3592 domain-containing protein n=1 Tax=uncultured Psychroserpens sp. TaxID=255436 RepID=UPI0026308DA9|nr:DUF3592 domain-containing protein [uncultured Psychroserpens sp.]